jgi:hypothetical protein
MSVWLGGQDDAMRPDWWGPNARSLDRAGPAYQIKRVMVGHLARADGLVGPVCQV